MTKRKPWKTIAKCGGGSRKKRLKEKRKVKKWEYFEENELDPILNNCFCCCYASQFIKGDCVKCPINWDGEHCMNSYYSEWLKWEYSYWFCSYYADLIANLPERETKDFDVMEEDKDENFDSM